MEKIDTKLRFEKTSELSEQYGKIHDMILMKTEQNSYKKLFPELILLSQNHSGQYTIVLLQSYSPGQMLSSSTSSPDPEPPDMLYLSSIRKMEEIDSLSSVPTMKIR